MKDLIIVGASGFGRELTQYIEDINYANDVKQWNLLGYIDDNPDALEGISHDYRIIDSIKNHIPRSTALYVCGLAFPIVKKKLVTLLKDKGAKFATIIHPSARVSKYAKIGEGCVITPNSNINTDAYIGNFVSVLSSGIGHDASIGDYSTLSGHVWVNGHVTVGSLVYMGCGSIVAPSKKIGDGATVGIGSVVVTNVRPDTTVLGNPAKKLNL